MKLWIARQRDNSLYLFTHKPTLFCGRWCMNGVNQYYKKQGFEIVEHQGSFYESDDENWSGNGEELKTIEDVNNAHQNYIRRKFNEFKSLFG